MYISLNRWIFRGILRIMRFLVWKREPPHNKSPRLTTNLQELFILFFSTLFSTIWFCPFLQYRSFIVSQLWIHRIKTQIIQRQKKTSKSSVRPIRSEEEKSNNLFHKKLQTYHILNYKKQNRFWVTMKNVRDMIAWVKKVWQPSNQTIQFLNEIFWTSQNFLKSYINK